MKIKAAVVVLALLAGCATVEQPAGRAVLVHGTIAYPTFTGWARDYCGDGVPVPFDQLRGNSDCLTLGGEIYKANLQRASIVGGDRLKQNIKVAYVGHALPKRYEATHYMILQPAPADFRVATGISYIVGDRDGYDPIKKCIVDSGYSHIRSEDCPDEAYHLRHRNDCVPIAEYVAHYSAVP